MDTREVVLRTKLTDAELGVRLGVSERTIYRWRGGKGVPQSMGHRKMLARIAGVDHRKVDWLK